MRLTSNQIWLILDDLASEQDQWERHLLITDRIKHFRQTNPDFLERILANAWDRVFGVDPTRWWEYSHLCFANVRERLLNDSIKGYSGRRLVKLLELRVGLHKAFDINIDDLVSDEAIEKAVAEGMDEEYAEIVERKLVQHSDRLRDLAVLMDILDVFFASKLEQDDEIHQEAEVASDSIMEGNKGNSRNRHQFKHICLLYWIKNDPITKSNWKEKAKEISEKFNLPKIPSSRLYQDYCEVSQGENQSANLLLKCKELVKDDPDLTKRVETMLHELARSQVDKKK
jgi:hypothetical protein